MKDFKKEAMKQRRIANFFDGVVVINSLLGLLFLSGIVTSSDAKSESVSYEPIKMEVANQTAECMYDWIQGSLNRGVRDREVMVDGAVNMCSGVAFRFGWTRPEMTSLANHVFRAVPGVVRK